MNISGVAREKFQEITGWLRLNNSAWIVGRNAANTADVNIARVNSSDKVEFGPLVAGVFSLVSYASASSTVTNSTVGAADLDGMSLALTTTGADLLLFFSGVFKNSHVGFACPQLYYSVDGGADQDLGIQYSHTANYNIGYTMVAKLGSLAAGSHTVKIRWSALNVGVTLSCLRRHFLLVELKG